MTRFLIPLLLLLPSAALAEKEVLETATLQPGEKKEVSVDAGQKVRLGWQHPEASENEVSGKCRNNCVKLTTPSSGSEIASMYGASMGVMPVDGKAVAVFGNLEAFPIEIEIYKK